MQVDHQPALQARFDAFLQVLDLARGAVGRDDDLLVLIDQRIECVKEFLLRGILAGNELHVIDHQHVDRAEDFLEIHDLPFAQRLHEAVHELLGRQVKHAQVRAAGLQFMRDGMHQVGLAQADPAVQEQGVEGDRPALGHPAGGGMGQFVGLADHKTVEGKARIQRRARPVFVGARAGARWLGRGFDRPRHGGGMRSVQGPDREFHPIHRRAGTGQLRADVVGIVALDPVAEKDGRHFEPRDAVL